MPVTKEELLYAMIQFRERGTATGFRIKGRTSLLITTVEDFIEYDGCTEVVVNEHSIYGERLTSTRIAANDIEQIIPLRVLFNDPFYVRLRSLRISVTTLRHNSDERRISLV